MTTLLSINQLSRTGGSADYEPFIATLHRLGPVVVHDACGEESLDDAIDAVGDRLERIVVGGGDGTLNRSLPAVRRAGVPLGILPLGTANDFARSLGLPSDPVEALETVLDGKTRKIGLGRANGRWFLNAAGVGLGPELTKNLDRDRKRRLGVLAYLMSLIEVIGNRRRRRALLEIDGVRRRLSFMQITIANGVHYGGGLTVARDVELDDGKLRVLVLKPQTPLELLGKFFTLRHGVETSEGHDKLELYDAEKVKIWTKVAHDVTVDGELAQQTPLECECVPDALEVYAPPVEEDRAEASEEATTAELVAV